MNYSRNIKKASIGKRVLISWVVVAVVFFLIGLGTGAAVYSRSGNAQKQTEPPEPETEPPKKEVLIFGQPDGIIFEGELPGEWANGAFGFVPLDVPMDEGLQEFVFCLSQAYEMDFTFVMAIIQQESSFRADAISESNDYGLMQVNEKNHALITETLGVTDFLEPYNNVRSGMFILRKLFEKYETPEKVLMAYNLGESGAARLWENGIFEINYSKSVFQYQQKFNEEIERRKEDD